MPYYPKQGAIADSTNPLLIKSARKSKSVWSKLYKNFLMQRKSPSYSVCIREGYAYGRFKLMCRDKWEVTATGQAVCSIVLEVQTQDLARMRGYIGMPDDNIVAVIYPTGRVVLHRELGRFLGYRARRYMDSYLNRNHKLCVSPVDGAQVYVGKDCDEALRNTPRQPVTDPTLPFDQHMNQWRVA